MAYGDPVLQRPLFQTSPGLAPSVGGTSPDDNARALRNMFTPTVSIDAPAQMIQQEQQPVQSFQTGGEVIDQSGFFPGTEPIPQEPTEGLTGIRGLLQRGALGLQSLRPLPSTPITFPQEGEMPPRIPGRVYDLPEATDIPPAPSVSPALAEQRAVPMAAAPAQARPKGALELTLEGIRAERARSSEDKRQNALLALMQAGFAAAAGRSPNALSNIAAGGQAGVGAFAAMEKDRRADLASLRREETAVLLERERMRAQEERAPEQIRTLAMLGGWTPEQGREGLNAAIARGMEVQKSMQQDPDLIRTARVLGDGDVRRGFEIYNSDRRLQAAVAITKDITASEEDRRAANEYIRGQLNRARTAGGGQAPPPGSTVIPLNQLPVR